MFTSNTAPPAYGPDALHAPPPRGRDEQLAMSLLHLVKTARWSLPHNAVASETLRRLRRVMFVHGDVVTTVYLDHARAIFYCSEQTGTAAMRVFGPLPIFGE
jgi:hypothetical protein